MNPGKLDRLCTMQTLTAGRDSGGTPTESWGGDLELWCGYEEKAGREWFGADQRAGEDAVVFTIRYGTNTSGLTTKDRIVFESKNYNILSIKEMPGRKRVLAVLAAARAD